MNSPEILKQHFSPEEIKTLEARADYAETVTQIEQMQADQQLDELEARATQNVSATADENARWEAFKASINEVKTEATPQTPVDSLSPPTTPQEETTEQKTAKAEEALRAKIRESGGFKAKIGEWGLDWVKDAEASLKDAKGIDKIFWELSLEIGLWLLSIWEFSELYDGFKKEVADISAGVVDVAIGWVDAVADGVKKGMDDIDPSTKENAIYMAGVETLLFMSDVPEESQAKVEQIFTNASVKEMSYNDLLKNGLTLEGQSPDDIMIFQKLLKDQESLFASLLEKKHPDWKSLTLWEIFGELGKYGDIFTELDASNINLDTFLNGVSFWNISVSEWNFWWNLRKLMENTETNSESPFHKVSKGLLLEVFQNNMWITDPSLEVVFQNNDYWEKNKSLNSQDDLFENKLINFWRTFQWNIPKFFYLWDEQYRGEFQDFFLKYPLGVKEITEIMLITGWEVNPENYSEPVKSIIYLKLWNHMWGKESTNSVRSHTYDSYFATLSIDSIEQWVDNVPQSFKRIALNLYNKWKDALKDSLTGSLKIALEMFQALPTEYKILIWWLSIASIFVLFQSRLFLAKASWLGAWLVLWSASILFLLAEGAFASPWFKEAHPEYKNPDDFYKKMVEDLWKQWIETTDLLEARESGKVKWLQEMKNERWEKILSELQNDGKEYILSEKESVWKLSIELIWNEWKNKEVGFFIDGVRKTIYADYGPDWAINDVIKTSFFVKDRSGNIFLVLPPFEAPFKYISLNELAQKIETGWSEYVVAEDVYIYWDLMMEWNAS